MEFLRTSGRIIINESGQEIILKGFGAGNWMNQEGFLFGSHEFNPEFKPFRRADEMDRGRSINQTIIEVCGRDYADLFWKKYYRSYLSEADIKNLAELGFNSIRLPLNARALMKECPGVVYDEEVFRILDQVIDWCEDYGIYVILDMHAAVAGQSAILCDDGVDNIPHLFIDEEGWERTMLLWETIAKRYAQRSVVAGFELLNEPLALPAWNQYLPMLIRFYDEAIERIRKIDKKHIIFLQGHRFASRTDIFRHHYDPECHNWVMAMHMYEPLPDLGTLGPILAVSSEQNIPVWMGETGGNNEYMTVLYEMLYENHIGVNVWCHKGEEHADGALLYTFVLPEGFKVIRDYAQKGGQKPGYDKAIQIFDQFLENIKFENCKLHIDRANAILRRPDVRIPAVGYDMMPGIGKSFKGTYPYCVFSGYRREDRMHIVNEPDFTPYESPDFVFVSTERSPKYGDWMHLELMLEEEDFACYTIREVVQDCEILITYRAARDCDIKVTAHDKSTIAKAPASEVLTTVRIGCVSAGEDTTIKVECLKGEIILHTVLFRKM